MTEWKKGEKRINREELIDEMEWEEKWLADVGYTAYNVHMSFDSIKHKVNTLEQESEAIQFARWVASEIFSDMWELNKDAFDELACRKLGKLGIVRANGDEWELVEPQESEGEK